MLSVRVGKIPPWEGGKRFVKCVSPFSPLCTFIGHSVYVTKLQCRAFFQTPQESAIEFMHALYTDGFLSSPAPPEEQARYPTMLDLCLAKQMERIQRLGPAKGSTQQLAAVATHSVSDERLAKIRDSGIATMVIGAADDRVHT